MSDLELIVAAQQQQSLSQADLVCALAIRPLLFTYSPAVQGCLTVKGREPLESCGKE